MKTKLWLGGVVAVAALALSLPAAADESVELVADIAAPVSPLDVAPKPAEITLLYTGDTGGGFAPLSCAPRARFSLAPVAATFAHTVTILESMRQQAEQEGAPAPIVLDTGDIFGPAGFLRYALRAGGDSHGLVVDLVARAGYDVVALGNADLAPTPTQLAGLLRPLRERGVRLGAVNLTCDPATSQLCDVLATGAAAARVINRGGVRVGIIPVTHPKLALWVDPVHTAGLTFGDPVASARKVMEAMKAERRADVFVVVAHVESSGSAPRESLALARALPGANVVIANGFGDRGRPAASTQAVILDGGQPLIVGAPVSPGRVGALVLRVQPGEGGSVEAMPSPAIEIPAAAGDAALSARIAALRDGFCEECGRPLGNGKLAEGTTPTQFLRIVGEIVRRRHEASIALLNREAVALDDGSAVAGAISTDRLFRFLPYDDRLVVASVKGADLAALLGGVLPAAGPTTGDGLHVIGAEKDEDTIRVNGRRLESGRRYRVVTLDFLARGGDGHLNALAGKVSWKPAVSADEPDATLRAAVVEFFREDRQRDGRGGDLVHPRETFRDLYELPLWTLSADINGTLSHVGLREPGAYDQSQLTREEALSLKSEGRLGLDVAARDHAFSALLELQYGGASTGGESFAETKDLIDLSLSYRWQWLRAGPAGGSRWVPVPYARTGLESEFSVPAERDDRHLEVTVETGLEWALWDNLSASFGYGFRRQTIQEDDNHHGLMFRYDLKRSELFDIFAAPLYFESRLELFYSDIAVDDTLKGTAMNRVSLQVFGPLNFTVQHDLFLYRVGSGPLAVSSDTQVGIQLYLDTLIQTF